MAQILNFILRPKPPTQAEFEEICPDGGTIPDCEIHVEPDYWGAPPPTETYGDLEVVNCPMESLTAKCGSSVSVWMEPGCPPDTPDLVCDDAQNPTEIAPYSSETIYILDGYPPYRWTIVGGVDYGLKYEYTGDLGGRPDERSNSQNILYSSVFGDEGCGAALVKITDNCLSEVICQIDTTVSSQLNWDWISSGETIVMGQSGVTIAVRDGTGPYTWSLEGNGFNLGATVTSERFNSLNASWCACGSAIITVVDACGSEATGSVRCTDRGEWKEIFPGGSVCKVRVQGVCDGESWIEGGKGAYKIKEHIGMACRNNDHTCPPENCVGADRFEFDPTVCGGTCLVPSCPEGELICTCWAQNLGGDGCGLGYHETGNDCCALSSTLDNQIRFGVFSRRTWEWVCPDNYEMEYDWGNSAQTVVKSSSATVYVTGGTPPYTWDISGTGFSLQHLETTGLSNTVITSSGACGSGVITVEDRCDFQIEGSIRCSDGGAWVQIEHTSNGDEACGVMRGVGVDVHNTWSSICDDGGCYESWQGKYHVYEIANTNFSFWHGYPHTCDVCDCDYYIPNGCVTCLQNTVLDCAYADPGHSGTFPCCYFYPLHYCKALSSRLLEEWKCP